jgi:hypothetical protein
MDNKEQLYAEYLSNHREGVQLAWESVLKPELIGNVDKSVILSIDACIQSHDASKESTAEWAPYLNWFYGDPPNANANEFNKAWLHHIHANGHHWQHWVLLHDEGDWEALDMPLRFVIEMLCDWQSFSLKDPSSTAYKFYQDNYDTFIMSDNTRNVVEYYLQYLKSPLKKEAV